MVGMGKELCANFLAANQIFENAGDLLGFDLKKMCFEGPDEKLQQTSNTQPALLTLGVALFNVLTKEFCISPDYLAGHSLGEITALTCSGVLSFEDALKIVSLRGRLMEQATFGMETAMMAIRGLDEDNIRKIINDIEPETVVISNLNSDSQIVVSGLKSAIDNLVLSLKKLNCSCVYLKVSGPFHSNFMLSAATSFREELSKFSFCSPQIPVLSNYTGQLYTEQTDIPTMLFQQMISVVRWKENVSFLEKQGVLFAVELGERPILTNLCSEITDQIECLCCSQPDKMKVVQKKYQYLVKQFEEDKQKKIQDIISKLLKISVCIKNQNNDYEDYQKNVVASYRHIHDTFYNHYNDADRSSDFTEVDLMKSLEYFKILMVSKKVDINELESRCSELINETAILEFVPDFSSASIIL